MRFLFHRRQATRAHLAQALRIRKSAITDLCNRLIADQTLREANPERQRNVLLQLNPDRFVAIGLQHAERGVCGVRVRADLSCEGETFYPLAENLTGAARLDAIADCARRYVRVAASKQQRIGVGFCDIGMVDAVRGYSIRAAAVPGWENLPVRDRLKTATGLPVELLMHTDSLCLAEKTHGAAKAMEAFIFIQVGRRIGLSVFLNGGFLRGNTNFFGELGHTVVAPAGDICKCGNRGCLETVASTDAVVRKVRDHLTPGSPATAALTDGVVTIDTVLTAARQGNKLARLALEEAALAVGNAAAFIINILGIDNLVLGGKLTEAGDLFLDPVRGAVARNCVHPVSENVTVCLGQMGEYGSATGAALAVLQAHFAER
ncbi:MAG: hypothetical protein A3K19_16875 [Lentisphaerae bacterium RIFOXYB12_FULL_65_16]|nr:MAG: hypothetical protein A3K18_17835 [Lentisphaerae bacterium RIFOXYA12_64_32]OGV88921.1 MAG: hypothetical protein A3K19_16875 [Lentisphaerae bacterium RIFOXYB12_FULL_65_16]